MYKNDNDGKLAVIAIIFAMIIFALVSCGKEMRTLRGGTQDIARSIYERAGVEASNMEEIEISSPESYIIGISEIHFLDKIEKVCLYRPAELSAEKSLCVVIAKNEKYAEEIFGEMTKNYEWAPCDPSQSAVFMLYDKYVLLGKDSEEGVRAVAEAFDAETNGGARVEFSHNPM